VSLKWYEQANIIESEANKTAQKAQSAWYKIEADREARARERAEYDAAHQEKRIAMTQQLNRIRLKQKVADYAKERGVRLSPSEIASGVDRRVNLFSVIDKAATQAEINASIEAERRQAEEAKRLLDEATEWAKYKVRQQEDVSWGDYSPAQQEALIKHLFKVNLRE